MENFNEASRDILGVVGVAVLTVIILLPFIA